MVGEREEETTRVDGGETFEACLERVRGERGSVLNGSFVYLLVPGLFASYYPLYYDDVRREFGARARRLSHQSTAWTVKARWITTPRRWRTRLNRFTRRRKRVIVFGHSKSPTASTPARRYAIVRRAT